MYLSHKFITNILLFYIRQMRDHPAKLRIVNFLLKTFYKNGMLLENAEAKTQMRLYVDDWMDRNLILFGNYEPLSIGLAASLLKQGGNFLDVGANVGLYSCELGNIDGVKVFSVEPGADAVSRLKVNLGLNPRVRSTVFHFGLASTAGIYNFETEWLQNLGTARIVKDSLFQPSTFLRYAIACVSISQLLEYIGQPIDVMKMDVEGFEWEILKGLATSNAFKPKNIIMEFKDHACSDNFDKAKFIEFINELGYAAFSVSGTELTDYRELPEHNIWLKLQ